MKCNKWKICAITEAIIFTLVIICIKASSSNITKDIYQAENPNGKYKLVIRSINEPFLFGSQDVNVIAFQNNQVPKYLMTVTINNDGKTLGDNNFDVIWEDDSLKLRIATTDEPNLGISYTFYYDEIFIDDNT